MLEGDHVILTPFGSADVSDAYLAWLNDPDTLRYLNLHFGQTRESVLEYVASFRPPNLLCQIRLKPDSIHVGNISLSRFEPVHRHAELGIAIGVPQARGRGIGTEACSLLIQHAFDRLNLHRVTAGTVIDNVAMTKVFLKLGFKVEGTLRAHHYLDGRYTDAHRFGLIRDEFIPVQIRTVGEKPRGE